MSLVLKDRVRETATVVGTGDAALLGAVTGFQSFSVVGNTNTCYYAISDQSGGDWEVGVGTYSTTGPTLARTTVLASSNSGSKVSFTGGTKDIFLTYPSEKAVYLDANGSLNIYNNGELRLNDTTGGEYVALKSPSSLTASYTLTMPVDDGTNGQALVTDGSGNLSWSTAASGDVYGPASATSTAVALFDGTTGKLIKNSGVTIDGSNNVSGVAQLNATTVDLTNLEVTNIKAKDGTAAGSIANSTGVVTLNSAVLTTADINGGTIDATSIGATTPNTGVFTQVDIAAQGDLRLQDTTGGEYVALQAPATLAASYTLTMPVDDGTSGQVLITDGSGVLSWATNASGDVNGPASATDNAIARFDLATGKLIQNSTVTLSDTGEFSGATLNVDTNTVSGVAASSFVLSNASGNIDGAAAQKVIPTGAVVGTTDTQTLTNKTINLTNNTLVATSAQIAAAVTDETGSGALVFNTSPTFIDTIFDGSTLETFVSWDSSSDSYSIYAGGATQTHRGMKRCLLLDNGTVNYYLDPADSTKKANGSAAVLTGADGMVMVEIPKFYMKKTKVSNLNTWYISAVARDGYTVHPAFVKNGVEVNYRYYSAYDACYWDATDSTYKSGLNLDDLTASLDLAADKLSSVSGVYPIVGVTRAECRALAANRGTGWRQGDAYLWNAILMLYLTEYGNFNSQLLLGAGNTNGSYVASSSNQNDSPSTVAGASNGLGNSSTNAVSGAGVSAKPGTSFMSYRGIENFYGNCWKWVDGWNMLSYQSWMSNNNTQFADDTSTNYTSVGATVPTTSGQYVTNLQDLNGLYLPSSVGGSSTTYITDAFYIASGNRVVRVGGSADNGAAAGAFAVLALSSSANSGRTIGARLAF